MAKNSVHISGKGFFHSELIYDNEGLTIYRSPATPLSLLLFSIAMVLFNAEPIISGFQTHSFDRSFFIKTFIVLTLISLATFSTILLIRFWRKNQRAYTFEEIVEYQIESNSKHVKLTFLFEDGTSDTIKLKQSKNSEEFINLLNTRF